MVTVPLELVEFCPVLLTALGGEGGDGNTNRRGWTPPKETMEKFALAELRGSLQPIRIETPEVKKNEYWAYPLASAVIILSGPSVPT